MAARATPFEWSGEVLPQRDVQKLPKAQRIRPPPRYHPLQVAPFEVAQKQHPEPAARRPAEPTDAVGVELRALPIDEGIEARLVEHAIHAS